MGVNQLLGGSLCTTGKPEPTSHTPQFWISGIESWKCLKICGCFIFPFLPLIFESQISEQALHSSVTVANYQQLFQWVRSWLKGLSTKVSMQHLLSHCLHLNGCEIHNTNKGMNKRGRNYVTLLLLMGNSNIKICLVSLSWLWCACEGTQENVYGRQRVNGF